MFYSMGLSGWFFEYPFLLMLMIFVVLAIPLFLILLKSPKAPKWNIAALWIIVILMTLRSASVFLFPISSEELLVVVQTLFGVVFISLGWAIVWTLYFRKSVRVRNTLGRAHHLRSE